MSKALSPLEENVKVPKAPIEQTSPQILQEITPTKPDKIIVIPTEQSINSPHSISNTEIVKQRVKNAREELQRRKAETKIDKQMELEMKMEVFREAREHTVEIFTCRKNIEEKELELKRSFIEAQAKRKQIFLNEKMFITQFAQAKNMIGKLMKNSDLERFKSQHQQNVKDKVLTFKKKNQERRELVQAILFEKFKDNKKNTL